MASLLELSGAQPQKQPHWAPMFMDREFTGLFTQRAPVHDPADIYTAKYYGGRPDALWLGANLELTNRLTLQRRPGLSNFTTDNSMGFVYPTQPLTSYAFQLINGSIRVMIDTSGTGPSEQDTLTSVATSVGATAIYTGTITSGANNGLQGQSVTVAGFTTSANNGVYVVYQSTATQLILINANAVAETHAATATTMFITSVASSSGGNAVYTGVFTNGATNTFVGLKFLVSGFTLGVNNGTFVCVASSNTTLTLANPNAISETHNATTISAGAVYWDRQDGTAELVWAKSPGAGQTHFIGSGGYLYFGNGVDTKKYTPFNTVTPDSVWNWGIVAPSTQPSIHIVSSGAANTSWQASTWFSTMGIIRDAANDQLWQLIGVNANPGNPNSANAEFGIAGTGGPDWNQTLFGNTTDGGNPTAWINGGRIVPWQPAGIYGDAGNITSAGSQAAPIVVYDPGTNALFLNFNGGGGLSRSSPTVQPPWNTFNHVGGNYSEHNGAGGSSGGTTYNQPHWFFWCNASQLQPWAAGHSYTRWAGLASDPPTNAAIEPFIVPPPTGSGTPVYLQVPNQNFTSSAGSTPFPAAPVTQGQQIADIQGNGQLLWQCVSSAVGGGGSLSDTWKANFSFTPFTAPGVGFSAIYDGANIQVCVSSTGSNQSGSFVPGTSIASAVSISASNASSGLTTYTLGAGSWAHTPASGDQILVSGFVANATNNGSFTVSSATSNTIIAMNALGVSETHSATIVFNPWGTAYGNSTNDGGLIWKCVANPVAWNAGATWNLPLGGYLPPSSTQSYGGSTIVASGTVQTVVQSGESGTPTPPVFASPTASNPYTLEGPSSPQLEWFAESFFSSQSLAFSKGYSYAYSYKARPLNDIYSAPPLGGIDGIQQIPPGGTLLVTPPFGSQTNAVSSASPANTFTGSNTGAVIFVSGQYSSDPQVDTIIIWRSADGGGPSQMFELTEINNIVGGGTWTFKDFLPDAPTSMFPGLNTLIPAPINGVNDPPVADFLPQVFNFERIWGIDKQYVAFSGGPDTRVGNPDEAFFLSDSLPFLAPVTRVAKSAQGLVTFLTDSIEVIIGGPATASFSSVTWALGIGLLSWNALDQLAGEIYFFSADNQFRVMTPSLNIQNAGFPLGDQFANLPSSGAPSGGISHNWDPKQVYVASHQDGIDNCIMVADGNTGWYRLNPRQAGGVPNTEPVWSPYAVITNGCQMVNSTETAPGIHKLLVGSQIQNEPILVRNLTTFSDNGTTYDAFFEMGNITLAHPGQIAVLKFLEMDFSTTGFQPTVSFLLNEVSGTFTNFVTTPVFDPPQLYGATIAPGSYSPNRYYFGNVAAVARCRHLRIRVDWGNNTSNAELYNMTIFGRLLVEM